MKSASQSLVLTSVYQLNGEWRKNPVAVNPDCIISIGAIDAELDVCKIGGANTYLNIAGVGQFHVTEKMNAVHKLWR